ncbi:MAG: hypothetical protein B5M48_03450 [Candidatus Omnitrophica bacterium 4484_213]|nr:MAG: hypothetical protein B5M48_03450 [Candidatus Omnitrophica bacterium 4484_213]
MFKVTIINPREILYLGLGEEVVLPTEEGELTLLEFHQPLLTRLHKGTIKVDKRWFFSIKDGIAHMRRDELVAIVE